MPLLAASQHASATVEPAPAAKPARPAKQAPTEVPGLRTANSNTYDNHDGSYTAAIAAEQINYKPTAKGGWQPIDLTFAPIANGNGRVRVSKTPVPVEVGSPDDASGFVSVDTGKGVIRLRLAPGAAAGKAGSKPGRNAGRADLSGLLPGVDLRVLAAPDGIRTFLVLSSVPSSSSFTFRLDSATLAPTLQADGSIAFADKNGVTVATMPQPYAMDSTADERLGSGLLTDKVSYSLGEQGNQTLLKVSVDPAWLAHAVYPVYVDPSVTISGAQSSDTFVDAKYPTTNFNTFARSDSPYYHEMLLGMDPVYNDQICYDYMKFTLPADVLANTIDLAQLKVFPYHQYYNPPTATTTWVDRVNATWTAGSLTWNNKPGSTNITSAALVEGQTGVFNVTSTVQDWANGAANYGFKLHENGHAGTYWKRLIASEQGGSNIPRLYVEYHRPTATVDSPTGSAWTNDRTLTWLYDDDENLSQTKYEVEVATDSAFANKIHASGQLSGSDVAYLIPQGTSLTSGATYYWHVRVYNGSSWSAFTDPAAFRWDSAAPTWHGFTAPAGNTKWPDTEYTFGWNAATDVGSGLAAYEWSLQTATIASPGICDTDWYEIDGGATEATSVTPSLDTGGCYKLVVHAIDGVDNYSADYETSSILVDSSEPDAPAVTDGCDSLGSCIRVGDTVYFRPNASSTVQLTSTGTDDESGIVSSTFGALSVPAGWTYTSGTVAGNPASRQLTWSTSAGQADLHITTKNGAGLDSAATTITFVPDAEGPTGDFDSPDQGTLVLQGDTGYSVSWSEADVDGSGVATRSLQRQRGSVVTQGACASVSWSDDGSPTTDESPVVVTDLVHGFCYRWVLTLTDEVGNSADSTSGSLLIDTGTPDLPDVTAGSAPGVYQPGANGTVFFKPAAAGPVTLSATAPVVPESGISCIAFSELSAPTGWAPSPSLPSCVESAPYNQILGFDPSAGSTTVDVTVRNGVGADSDPRTIALEPDTTAPAGDFVSPAEGSLPLEVTPSYTVEWAEADAGSGVASRSLQRQKGGIVTPGSCNGVPWANDGDPTAQESPVTVTIGDGYCYRWVLSLTDNLSNSSNYTSGSVLIDTTAPTATIDYPEAGRPLSGNVTVTGTATDANFASWTLEFGSGTAPESWTLIASSNTEPVASGTLDTFSPGALTGIYTLRLRVSDAVGHESADTHTVYLDNTDRGESYYTSVPFDLEGGWNLGVNVATGEASLSRGLFTIPSYGPPQALGISYNSGDTSSAGRFGPGWSSNLTQYLTFDSGFVVWHRADGGTVPFGQVNGSWVAMAGHYETLTQIEGGYRITDTDRSLLTFDGSGRLTAMTNSFDTSLTLSWGSSSATATDASGRHTDLALDSSGRIISATDSAGREWSFGYTDGRLTTFADPMSYGYGPTTLTYDTSGRLASISRQRTIDDTPTTVIWGLTYDATGKAETVVDPIGGTSHAATFTYGTGFAAGDTVVVRPRDVTGVTPDSTTTYTLDAARRGWVASVEEVATVGQTWTTSFDHDASGNVTSESRQIDNDDNHATTTWTYKSWGAVETQIDPYGIVTTYTYSNDEYHNLRLQVVSHTAGGQTASQTTAYAYNSAHQLCREVANPTVDPTTITCTSALGSGNAADEDVEHRYTYNAHNLMETQTDPLGVVTKYEYDANGDQISVTRNYEQGGPHDASTNLTTYYDYDPAWAGNVSSEWRPISTNPTVNTRTRYQYDLLGRGTIQTEAGDENIAASGSWTNYDEFGTKIYSARSLCTLPPPGANCNDWTSLDSVFWMHDALGHLTEQSDWTPATEVSGAVMATATYVPDLAGDVLSATDANGVTTESTFNALGQVLTQTSGGATTTHLYDGLGRDIETTAPGSATAILTTTRTYDAAGHVLTQSETDSSDDSVSTTTYEYDLLGRLTKTTAPEGQITTQSYDALGRVVTSASGTSATDTEYDRAGNVVATSDPYVSTDPPSVKTYSTTTYDALGRATATTHSGVTTHVYFDVADNVVAAVDADGVITRTFYNVRADVTKTIVNCTNTGTTPPEDPLTCAGTGTQDSATNLITESEFGPNGGVLRSKSFVAGVETRTEYDGSGRALSTTVDYGTGRLNLTTSYSYDGKGRQIAVTDPMGVVTGTAYDDESGRVCRTVQNLDPTGALTCTTELDASDGTTNLDTRYEYDEAGNKTLVTAPNGTLTRYEYDGDGNLKSEISDWVLNDPNQGERTTAYFYDGDGRQIRVMDPAGTSTSTAYDANGRVCREVANISAATLAELEALTDKCNGTISGKTASANVETRYQYDAAGNKIHVESPSPADEATPSSTVITLYTYDSNQRLCRVVENAAPSLDLSALANPCTTAIESGKLVNVDAQYTYDDTGNMTSQLTVGDPPDDPSGTTSWTYDALGRPKTKTDPLGNVEDPDPDVESHTTHWTYDLAGNKASQIDPNDAKTFWFYDAAGRMCRRIAIAAGVNIETVDFPAQPCTDQTVTQNAALDTRYVPDASGNPAGIIDLVAGRTIATTYDDLSRPISVTDSALEPTTTYTYGPTEITRADPAGSHVFTLDPFGRQVSLADPLTETEDNFAWDYESTGAVGAMVDPTLNETTYSHDPLGRLTGIALSGSSACSSCLTYAYAYNAAGNRIGSTRTIGTEETTTAYGYDALSRLLSYDPTGTADDQDYTWDATPDRTSIKKGSADPVLTAFDEASRITGDTDHNTTDLNGRVTKLPGSRENEVLALAYDPLGRLTSADSSIAGVPTATYTYDPLDRLASITTDEEVPTVTTFAYVGLSNAVAQVSVASGSTSTVTDYSTDLDGSPLMSFVVPTQGAIAPVFLGLDAHGDIAWTTNLGGALCDTATYDPFGSIDSGSIAEGIRWQGSWQDSTTGLYYVVARWYDTGSGRFLSEDPLTADAESPQRRSPYAYGAGDAIGNVDPDGRCVVDSGNPHACDGSGLPSMYWLNTSVVGRFVEPPKLGSSKDNHRICQSGAARVVLAFAGNNPRWNWTYQRVGGYGGAWAPTWPRMPYKDKHNKPGLFPGGVDTYGQGYMLFIAYMVQPPGWGKKTGLYHYTSEKDMGATVPQVVRVLNWEYSGEDAGAYRSSYPFVQGDAGIGFDAFDLDVETQLAVKHVPVQMAVSTGAPPKFRSGVPIGLPSWKLPSGALRGEYDQCLHKNSKGKCDRWSGYHDALHSIAIVGYDQGNYYYLDTCQINAARDATGRCGWTDPPKSTDPTKLGMWRVNKRVLHDAMLGGPTGGYAKYIGPPSPRATGY